MGTWATGTFGNDYAMDWAQDLQETSNLEPLESTIGMTLAGDGELEAPFAAEALAAIEVLARLQGNRGDPDEMPEIDDWVARRKQKVSPALAASALRAIERILSDQSELKQLWQDSEHYEEWRGAVLALQARVQAGGAFIG